MCLLVLSLNQKNCLKTGYFFKKNCVPWRKTALERRAEVAKAAAESPATHHQQHLHPTARLVVSPLPSETYQNGGDDKRPVSQGIRDVGRPVLVAVRHVKATV